MTERNESEGGILAIAKGCRHKALAVAILAGAVIATTSVARAQEEYGVLVSSLLHDIRDTLIKVRTGASGQLQLKSATLTLQAVISIEAAGKVGLFVVSLGGSVKQDSTQTIKITMAPPTGGDSLPVSETSDALAAAILASYEAVRSAETSEPPLRLDEMTATVNFVLAKEGEGGVDFKILPVTVELSGEVTGSNLQELELTFCKAPCD